MNDNKTAINDTIKLGYKIKFQERELPEDEALYGILEQVKLKKSLDSLANTLSGGEKQRLALGRILLFNPEAYLLDEPSAALDDQTEEAIIEMVTGHVKDNNKTLVMVTHSKAIAAKYADTIIEIAGGRCSGPIVPSPQKMDARSITFHNSRTFPGNGWSISRAMAFSDTRRSPPSFSMKCSTRSGMSSRRSRRGGSRISKTFRR
ncbi:MAG: ATP-binding cassette domain-containing protein [Deltaproteobacteria bacterium]|nr:MAG: ATP-binding cassette domain-containing protein [Deltaproteobacteria bacterium]